MTQTDPQELVLYGDYEVMNSVVEELLKGKTPPQIARHLDLKPSMVKGYVDRWHELAKNNPHIQGRAKEALVGADKHFSMIIKEFWDIAKDPSASTREKTTALKGAADTEKNRIQLLQNAGLLDNQEMAEKILDTERKAEAIVELLKDVASHCPDCKAKITHGLSVISGKPVGVVVEAEVI
jgi:hypothetical protein